MSSFTFLHAADLHLDSPLLGLSARAPDFAEKVEDASRAALDGLVALAIAERCRFVLLAGDVFDGDLRNVKAGLFLVSRLRRLRDAGIDVFVILGNHDAENRFMANLPYSENVHLFATGAAETRMVDGVDVAIHGRSFPRQDVRENIARDYPPPRPGLFNVGLLHTALIGHEGEHAAYAPCSAEQLRNHGYDYWALGHVHERAVLGERPYLVYPGNLQGRSSRETGSKGVTLVRVVDGAVAALEHRALDAVRWARDTVDVASAEDLRAVRTLVRAAIEQGGKMADGRPLALRLTLVGMTPLHGELALKRAELRDEAETMAAAMTGEIWLEKLVVATRASEAGAETIDPTVAGRLRREIRELGDADLMETRLEARLKDIRDRLPAGAREEELIERLRAGTPSRAVDLALALVDSGGGDDAVR